MRNELRRVHAVDMHSVPAAAAESQLARRAELESSLRCDPAAVDRAQRCCRSMRPLLLGTVDVPGLTGIDRERWGMVSGVTHDPNYPAIRRGSDDAPSSQAEKYLVLSAAERAKGFVRPFRDSYVHVECTVNPEAVTRMSRPIAEIYARNPKFYGGTFCVACSMHRPVSKFRWDGTDEVVGSGCTTTPITARAVSAKSEITRSVSFVTATQPRILICHSKSRRWPPRSSKR